MNRIITCLTGMLLFISLSHAQVNLDYQKPPKEILDLIDVPLAPSTIIDSEGK